MDTQEFMNKLRRGAARLTNTKERPVFKKTGARLAYYNVGHTKYSVAPYNCRITISLKPMGSRNLPENKASYFDVFLRPEQEDQANELVALAKDYFENRLGFHPLPGPPLEGEVTTEAFTHQLASLYAEKIKANTNFSTEGDEKSGFYSIVQKKSKSRNNPEDDTKAGTTFAFNLKPLGGHKGKDVAKVPFVQNVPAESRDKIPAYLQASHEFFASQNFFDVKKPLTEQSLEANIQARLRKLRQNEPEFYDVAQKKYKGFFSVRTEAATAKQNSSITLTLHTESDIIRGQSEYLPHRTIEFSTRSRNSDLLAELEDHTTTFMTKLGFENRTLKNTTISIYDRPIDKKVIVRENIKLVSVKDSDNFYIQLSPNYRVTTGTPDQNTAEKCLQAIREEYLAALPADAPLTIRGIKDFLTSKGLNNPKTRQQAILFGDPGKPAYGYITFISSHKNLAGEITIILSPANARSHPDARSIILHLREDALEQVVKVTRYALENTLYETGLGFAPPTGSPENAEHVQEARMIIRNALHRARRLSLRVDAQPIAGDADGRYALTLTPQRDFTDPLPQEVFPYPSISLIAPSKEAAEAFQQTTFNSINSRLEAKERSLRTSTPEPKLMSECVGGAIRDGMQKLGLQGDPAHPLPAILLYSPSGTPGTGQAAVAGRR